MVSDVSWCCPVHHVPLWTPTPATSFSWDQPSCPKPFTMVFQHACQRTSNHMYMSVFVYLCVQVRICQSTEWGLFSTLAVHPWSAYTRRTVRMHLLLIHYFLKCLFESQALLDIWWKDKPHHGLGSTETAQCFSKRYSLLNFDDSDDKHIARESP